MTRVKAGARATIEVSVLDGVVDGDGDVEVLVSCHEGWRTAWIPRVALRFDAEYRPTYLARREAMVRAMIESPFWQDAAFEQLVKEADIALRAIDETPVPEGGEDA